MNDMRIVDMHCDTLLVLRMTGRNLDDIDGHINIEKLRRRYPDGFRTQDSLERKA